MKSELTDEFIQNFKILPTRIQNKARKNFQLWQKDTNHLGLEFKKLKTTEAIYSIRVGLGWRALGVLKDKNTLVWFWIGSHDDYDKLIKNL